MANLLSRLAGNRRDEKRYTVDDYLGWFGSFSYDGVTYPFRQTLKTTVEQIAHDFVGYVGALRTCPPAFAAQLVRSQILSEVEFTFRNNRRSRTRGRLFGTTALEVLERPWPNATTGELVSKMEWHAGLAGNAYVRRDRTRGRLQILRPDWVSILMGSELEPEDPAHALDSEILGYVYTNGGPLSGNKPVTLLPEDVAHWSPLPDPECGYLGMSWITPAVRELQADRAATTHKLKFFENGATPNMVVKGVPGATPEQFGEYVDKIEARHSGVRNAYRTLYLATGADATVVGSDLKQLAFKDTQGAGETRIAQLARVPAVVLQIGEGLQGSSLNQGNFSAARRQFSDGWLSPTWRSLAAALGKLVDVPDDADLWYDPSNVRFLREDEKDAAEIEQIKALTIANLVKEGFTADSAKAAVIGQDMTLLEHTGLVSVQLQAPGAATPSPADA